MPIAKNGEVQNDELPYGNFKVCSTCNAELQVSDEDNLDDENLSYHGYCSRICASNAGYHNFQI